MLPVPEYPIPIPIPEHSDWVRDWVRVRIVSSGEICWVKLSITITLFLLRYLLVCTLKLWSKV